MKSQSCKLGLPFELLSPCEACLVFHLLLLLPCFLLLRFFSGPPCLLYCSIPARSPIPVDLLRLEPKCLVQVLPLVARFFPVLRLTNPKVVFAWEVDSSLFQVWILRLMRPLVASFAQSLLPFPRQNWRDPAGVGVGSSFAAL